MTVQVVAFGLDSLYVNFHGGLRPEICSALSEARERASAAKCDVPLPIGAIVHQVAATGARGGWAWKVECCDWRIVIAPRKSTDQAPSVQVQFEAAYLWAFGWEKALALFQAEVIPGFFEREPHKVAPSRADLTCDFVGWVPRSEDADCFVKQPRKTVERWRLATGELAEIPIEGERTLRDDELDTLRESYRTGALFTGWRWGARSASIVGRLYDKTEEIRAASGKTWFPDEVWRLPPEYDQVDAAELVVWRLEFEMSRKGLRLYGIDTIEDLRSNLARLWAALVGSDIPDDRTQERLELGEEIEDGDEGVAGWLSLREPAAGERSRWPLRPEWLSLQEGAWRTHESPLVQERRREMDRAQTLALVARGLFRLAVLEDVAPGAVDDVPTALAWLAETGLVSEYLGERNLSPAALIEEFRARLPLTRSIAADE